MNIRSMVRRTLDSLSKLRDCFGNPYERFHKALEDAAYELFVSGRNTAETGGAAPRVGLDT